MEPKKSASKDFENKKMLFFQTGLIITLLLVFSAFQWKSYSRLSTEFPEGPFVFIDDDPPPPVIPARPLPPPPPPVDFTPVPDDTRDDVPDFNLGTTEALASSQVPDYPTLELPVRKEEAPDENIIFIAVEEMPEFPGGSAALMSYLAKNTRYPALAKSLGINGTVFVSFVVEPDGSISNVQLARGIGGGCDEEAIRVISSLPRWKPGMQAGKPVRVAYSARIVFKLQ